MNKNMEKTQVIQALDSEIVNNYSKENNQVLIGISRELLNKIAREFE
jgi:hypothetical protein